MSKDKALTKVGGAEGEFSCLLSLPPPNFSNVLISELTCNPMFYDSLMFLIPQLYALISVLLVKLR